MMNYTISSTDICAIMGVSPYDSPVSLFLKKTGKLPAKREETFQMKLGKKLEATMRDLLIERGLVVISGNYDLRRRPERPEFIAVPDGFVNYSDGMRVVEQKAILHYVSHYEFYETQLRWQMMVCECNGLLITLTPNELTVKEIDRDIDKENKMVEVADWFLKLLKNNEMPSVENYHPATLDALKRMKRINEAISLDDAYENILNDIERKKEEIKKLEEAIEFLNSQILFAMKDATEAECGCYKIKVNKYVKKPSITISEFDDTIVKVLDEKNCKYKLNDASEVARLTINKKKEK